MKTEHARTGAVLLIIALSPLALPAQIGQNSKAAPDAVPSLVRSNEVSNTPAGQAQVQQQQKIEAEAATLASPRPRTLAAARALKNTDDLKASTDAVADYDLRFVYSVLSRWYELNVDVVVPPRGRAVFDFSLHQDGSISELTIPECGMDGLTAARCQQALLEAASYASWPAVVRRTVAVDHRHVRLTFTEASARPPVPTMRLPFYDLVCEVPYQVWSPADLSSPGDGSSQSAFIAAGWPVVWPYGYDGYWGGHDHSEPGSWNDRFSDFHGNAPNWTTTTIESIRNATIGPR